MFNNKLKRQQEAQAKELEDGTITEEFLKSNNPMQSQVGGVHYKDMKIQPVVFCHENGLGICESNVIKYVSRHRAKNGLQDLLKAKHYIDLLIELEYTVTKVTMHQKEILSDNDIDLIIGK